MVLRHLAREEENHETHEHSKKTKSSSKGSQQTGKGDNRGNREDDCSLFSLLPSVLSFFFRGFVCFMVSLWVKWMHGRPRRHVDGPRPRLCRQGPRLR